MRSVPTCPAEPDDKLTLTGLRHQQGLSQSTLASLLKVSQPYIAQLESQDDMHIATLGGELALFARYPGNSVEIALAEPSSK
jgi:predicted transcriptional regulator